MSLEESLVEHCAPILAGLKAASLYCFFPENNRQFVLQVKLWREWFACRGLRLNTSTGYEGLLRQLRARLQRRNEFPHEIGVFLGYPLEDVQGFMENQGRNYTCCGCWKSYGDPAQARRCFSSYRACTAAYKRRYADGMGVEQLTVAV